IEVWNELRNMICAPLRLENGWMGVLGARRREGEARFTPDDLRLLTTLTNMAAKAIESAHLHAELRKSYLVTVGTLVSSLHARDDYTAAHSQRVANLAVRIAERMELPEGLVRDLEVFGPLHDVGKIGIRDAILLKASALSEEERELCQEHCIIGERIIRPLKPSEHALAMVRSHHESWDGKGYPDGLSGEETPILARVLGVADCYDAMSTDRPYQPAMSEQEVLAHFRQYAGKRYDPRVVAALCAVVGQEERPQPAWAPADSLVERPRSKATARAAN
ncbi:MAG: HD-GYP domain-containing protein, partial [Armatimonadota bacterium]|nr:HD-GYP domain-containing protein [Armatimonadota bacterium]